MYGTFISNACEIYVCFLSQYDVLNCYRVLKDMPQHYVLSYYFKFGLIIGKFDTRVHVHTDLNLYINCLLGPFRHRHYTSQSIMFLCINALQTAFLSTHYFAK